MEGSNCERFEKSLEENLALLSVERMTGLASLENVKKRVCKIRNALSSRGGGL